MRLSIFFLNPEKGICTHVVCNNEDIQRARWNYNLGGGGCNGGAKRKSLVSIGFSLSVNQFIPNCPGLYICGEVPLI